MPGHLHATLVDLLRARPELLVELLSTRPTLTLPAWRRAEPVDADLSQPSLELRADLCVVLRNPEPVWVLVAEVQLHRDPDKPFAWAAYVATAHLRWRCPATLIVVCPDPGVAR